MRTEYQQTFAPRQSACSTPIGPMRYRCLCGKTYLTGATEWDYLSEWDKRQWRSDAGIAFILLFLIFIPIAFAYAAWHFRNLILLVISVVALIPTVILLRLFVTILLGFVDIVRSIWRTRIGSATG